MTTSSDLFEQAVRSNPDAIEGMTPGTVTGLIDRAKQTAEAQNSDDPDYDRAWSVTVNKWTDCRRTEEHEAHMDHNGECPWCGETAW